jgi:hypothetical protein
VSPRCLSLCDQGRPRDPMLAVHVREIYMHFSAPVPAMQGEANMH